MRGTSGLHGPRTPIRARVNNSGLSLTTRQRRSTISDFDKFGGDLKALSSGCKAPDLGRLVRLKDRLLAITQLQISERKAPALSHKVFYELTLFPRGTSVGDQ
jgi:hypothetical protein